MIYDKHTKIIESMVLYLHNLKPSDYVTYEQITSNISVDKIQLERILKNYEYSFLFETECLCSRNKGSSTEDMFLLSIEAERLISECNSWKGWMTNSYQKHLKLQAKYDSLKTITNPVKIIILAIYSILVTFSTLWLGYMQVSNEKMNNVDSKTIQELKDSNAKKDETITKLNKTLAKCKK